MSFFNKRVTIISSIVLLCAACMTYYQKMQVFQNSFSSGQYEAADKWLDENKDDAEGKNKLLYLLNKGTVSHYLKKFDISSDYLGQADNMIEDYIKNYSLEALTYLSNPTITPYKPEDFETVMVSYYQAMNYIKSDKYEEAIVECNRMNIKLNQLNDKYKDGKNVYKRDAFANYLMGMIYEANNNPNDAFIAYRNALEIYNSEYSKNYSIGVSTQLKKDILKTAYLTGFDDEVEHYKNEFNIDYDPSKEDKNSGELIFIWLNGLCPVKNENSFNFVGTNKGGTFVFNDANNDKAVAVSTYNLNSSDMNALSKAGIIRIAFPKYDERPLVYTKAFISNDSEKAKLEEVEDINSIAFKCLSDRMLREVGKAILRFAIKKGLEALTSQITKKELGYDLGFIVGAINAAIEKADTRHWQTLPHSIYVARIPLKEGSNQISFTYGNETTSNTETFTIEAEKNKKYFRTVHTVQ